MNNQKECTLWVLGSRLEEGEFNLESSDKVLFFSLSSIENLNSSTLSLENFYSRNSFKNEIDSFNDGLKNFLLSCDQILKSDKISGSFYDNGFWFVHRLSDLFFIHSLCDQLENQFRRVNLIVPDSFKALSINDCSIEDLRLENLGMGLEHSLQFLHFGLPKSEILYSKKTSFRRYFFERKLQLLKRSPEVIQRRCYHFFKSLRKYFIKPTTIKKILIPQTGYDIDFLIRDYSKETFKTINLIQTINDNLIEKAISPDTIESLEEEIDNFLLNFLPRFSIPLKKFFSSYIKNVSVYSNSIERQLKNTLNSYDVDALVFSNGATNLVDRKSCLISNQLNIPVIFMRHQGVELNFFPRTFLDDFCENDLIINRTQFLLNDYEIESYPTQDKIAYKKAGFVDFSKPLKSNKEKKGIIYSPGPPEHFTFKNPNGVITNLERFKFASGLINLTNAFNLVLDIKVHPAEWEISANFFHNLVENNSKRTKPKILLDGSIERILKNYQLIILDIISTKVLTFALYYDLQVILYVPKDYSLNDTTFQDLEKRIHIVRDNIELEKVIKKFYDGTLEKKSYPIFDKKYLRDLTHDEFIEEAYRTIVS